MSLNLTIARRLIDLVERIAPIGRKDWARAMRGELEALEHGQLGWSLGCLAAATCWCLWAERAYLGALVAILPLTFLASIGEMALIPRQTALAIGPVPALLESLLFAFLFGAVWPRRVAANIAIACVLVQHVGQAGMASIMLGVPFSRWFWSPASIYMMPPLLGVAAAAIIWWVGLRFGARWAEWRARSVD